MKKVILFLFALVLALTMALPAFANGTVTYSGDAGQFIFQPGSKHSPTDLFTAFKGVMPGDTLTQQITVQNNASQKVKIKVYMRSLGAHAPSVDFLSQLRLKVQKSAENEMGYMFDAPADQTAGLTDWVELGTLYSGGKVNLDLMLEVPVELDNQYSSQIGYLDWEFKIEEFPVEESDPTPPDTGDHTHNTLWICVGATALGVLLLLLFWGKRKKEE